MGAAAAAIADDSRVRLAFQGKIDRSVLRQVLGFGILVFALGSSMASLAAGPSQGQIVLGAVLAVALAIGGVLVSSSLQSGRFRVVLFGNGHVELRYPWPLSFLRRRYEGPFEQLRISHRFYKWRGFSQREDVLAIVMSDGRPIIIDSQDSSPSPADRLRQRAREVGAALQTYRLEDLTGSSSLSIDLREG